jgi:quercetin dioxygenase-like cupin family protein
VSASTFRGIVPVIEPERIAAMCSSSVGAVLIGEGLAAPFEWARPAVPRRRGRGAADCAAVKAFAIVWHGPTVGMMSSPLAAHRSTMMRHTLFAAVASISATFASAQELAKPDLLLKELVPGMPRGDKQEVRVLTATIQPGGKTPFHTHRFPVTVYVLEGTFTLELDGRAPMIVKAGQSAVEPANVRMTGFNRGNEPLKVVIFYVSDPDTPFLDLVHGH